MTPFYFNKYVDGIYDWFSDNLYMIEKAGEESQMQTSSV